MYTIDVNNVNHALPRALALLRDEGQNVAPRGAMTLEMDAPVTTTYRSPGEMVLFDPIRDANPFFHFFEALWILAGRKDVAFLSYFLPRMADFSDDGVEFHAPYGHRMRTAYGFDQIETCIEKLRADNSTRQAVLTIWHPNADFQRTKDVPCNDMIFLKIRGGELRMTVCCRSNDAILGAYGANVVQFSTLQKYIAGRVGVGVGAYTQVSDSFHVYVDNPFWVKWLDAHMHGVPSADDPYEYEAMLKIGETEYMQLEEVVTGAFDLDLSVFFRRWDEGFADIKHGLYAALMGDDDYKTRSFREVVLPMLSTLWDWRNAKDDPDLRGAVAAGPADGVSGIAAADWRLATQRWMQRRLEKQA